LYDRLAWMSEPKTKLKLIFKVPLMVSKKVIFPYLNSHCVNELFGLLFLKLQALQPSSFKHFSTVFSILLNWHSSLSKPFGFNAFPLLGNPFIQVICGAAKVNTQWRSAKLFSSFFKTFFRVSASQFFTPLPCFSKRMQMYFICFLTS